MKPSNPKFWTRDRAGHLEQRDLEREEAHWRDNIFGSFRKGLIDEPIVIYYEIYDCHSAMYKDDAIYQAAGVEIKKGDYVLDLGANIGIFSRWAADAGAEKIYSFEPIKENFQLLSLNAPSNCEVHRLAVSNKDNEGVQMAYKPWAPGGSSIVKHEGGELQTVMTITIDTLLENGIVEKIDFLKMDIEGAEVMAFEGISDDNLSKVRCVAMELHINTIGEEAGKKIYDRMERLGFKSFTVFNPDECNLAYFWK
jgi:FkbM family methyltransferase